MHEQAPCIWRMTQARSSTIPITGAEKERDFEFSLESEEQQSWWSLCNFLLDQNTLRKSLHADGLQSTKSTNSRLRLAMFVCGVDCVSGEEGKGLPCADGLPPGCTKNP